jgi:glucokinase
MNQSCIIGLDIGGTKTAALCGSTEGKILWRKEMPTGAGRGFEPVFEEITALVVEALSSFAGDVLAMSVSIGGPLDVEKGIIKGPPNLPGWVDIPLKALLAERFRVPVYLEHDGNAGALAEFYFGAGRGCKNIVFLTMGTGFGAGLILNGRLYRGTTDVAGEVGHIRIAEDGPDCYGKPGSLEGYASGTGIAKLAAMMYPRLWEGASVIDLSRAYSSGSQEAAEVFERAALYLGRGFALLADLLNPERIILGGLGLRLRDALVEPARKTFEIEALPAAREVCEILPASLGESIGDYASLCAALDQGELLNKEAT